MKTKEELLTDRRIEAIVVAVEQIAREMVDSNNGRDLWPVGGDMLRSVLVDIQLEELDNGK